MTGNVGGNGTFGAGQSNETVLELYAVYVARYASDGTLAWAVSARTDGGLGDGPRSISASPDGSSFITGWFSGTMTFGEGEPNETALAGLDPYCQDMYIAHYNPDGDLDWATMAVNEESISGFGISAVGDGSVLMTGNFEGTATFAPGETEEQEIVTESEELGAMFIAKYNELGHLSWVKKIDNALGSVTAFDDGSFLLTGYVLNKATFGMGDEPKKTCDPTEGRWGGFVAGYKHNGSLSWAQCLCWPEGQAAGADIALLQDGSFLVAGGFSGEITFWPEDSKSTSLVSEGDSDIFIVKIDPDRQN